MITPEKNPQDRIIYICGAGGTGKTTLISQLLETDSIFMPADVRKLERKTYNRKESWAGYLENTFEYAKAGIDSDAKRIRQIEDLAINHPNKILLADRSIFDTLSYIRAAEEFKDISKDQYWKLFEYFEHVHTNSPKPKNIILLNYSTQQILQNLAQRVKLEGPAFRDEDILYHGIVVSSFRLIFSALPGLSLVDSKTVTKDVLDFAKHLRIQSLSSV
jgi:deoxyadenosine/deoxycytidine kinase